MKLTRLSLLAVAMLCVTVASCDRGPSSPVAPTVTLSQSRNAKLFGLDLLACTPLTADSTTVSIGSAGGTINIGPHQLIVPAGALDSTVDITAIAPSDSLNRLEFYPNGLTFDQPATLVMSYANCSVLGSLPLHRIAYIDGSFNILDILSGSDNIFTHKVTSHLQHFSDYAIAW